jgi:mannose-1-phosphate guanylyltransferase
VWELTGKDDRGNVAPESAVLVDADRNLVVDLRTKKDGPVPVVALVGTADLCVVQTDDGLLVLPRTRSQDVRDVTALLKARGRGDLL